MRTALTWLVLANLFAQQFVCCAESCATCAVAEESHEKSDCGHDHHDEGPSPRRPTEHESSHHLCVATHLFFVKMGTASGIDLDVSHAIVSSIDTIRDSLTCSDHVAVVEEYSLPPPSALRQRALLSVWTV